MIKLLKFSVVILFVTGTGALSVKAQDKSTDTTARYFIIQASISNLQEVATSRVGASRAQNPQVKAFANRMMADHGKSEAQLLDLIKARGFQIPPEATDTPVEDMMLKNTPTDKFDRIFVHMMVTDHRAAVQLFEKYAWTGKDPDVRSFATQTLPVLKEHLQAIIAIDSSLTIGQPQ
jgi:putative membrane protein